MTCNGTPFFFLMVDECTNSLIFCIYAFIGQLTMHEDFMGLYHVTDTSISASTPIAVIKDCILQLNLKLSRCGKL